jgi:hypothetical protein
LTKRVIELKKTLGEKNLIFNKLKNEKFKPNPQNEEFFQQVEEAVSLFNKKAASAQLGSGFYNDFNTRIDDLTTEIKDYLMSRDLEKKDLTSAIQSGANYDHSKNFDMKGKFA